LSVDNIISRMVGGNERDYLPWAETAVGTAG
jgi:hypothetical protein